MERKAEEVRLLFGLDLFEDPLMVAVGRITRQQRQLVVLRMDGKAALQHLVQHRFGTLSTNANQTLSVVDRMTETTTTSHLVVLPRTVDGAQTADDQFDALSIGVDAALTDAQLSGCVQSLQLIRWEPEHKTKIFRTLACH